MASPLPQVRRIKLGSQGLQVSVQGLGCMGMSAFYGPVKPEPDMVALICHAVRSVVTFLDTSATSIPRFKKPENLCQNAHIFDCVNETAATKGCTPSQLALAWVHHQGDDVCPILGGPIIICPV